MRVQLPSRKEVRGPIAVSPAQLAEVTGAVPVAAGEQVSVTQATRSDPVTKQKINVNYEQAWADGWLVYEDRTVGEVAREFNRRNRTKIIVTDPVLAARRLALFRGRATDPESFVAAIAVSPDVSVIRDNPNVLRIERQPVPRRLDSASEFEVQASEMDGEGPKAAQNPA
jgi:ferric-dicitrate binding protein FerR (iron transport regulator)